MKRRLALALSAVMTLALAACASSAKASGTGTAEEPAAIEATAGRMTGGWTNAASPALTDEQRAVLGKALEGFAGSAIDPIAYLGNPFVDYGTLDDAARRGLHAERPRNRRGLRR